MSTTSTCPSTRKTKMPLNTALSHLLQAKTPLIADGALATELEARGCDLNDPLWSAKVLLESPHLIEEVHRDYFRAGAQIATTASYQATPQGFARRGIPSQKALELVSLSVQLAARARQEYLEARPDTGPLLIAGSVGPYGAYLADGSEYRGDYSLTPKEFVDFHRPRITALVDAGVDVLACETLPSFAEAEALLALTSEYDVESWFSFTLRDGGHISDGTPLEAVGGLLTPAAHVAAIGVNCVPIHFVAPALKALQQVTEKPLAAYPNSSETYDPTTKTWSPAETSPRTESMAGQQCELAESITTWLNLGARMIGGCCRTTPAEIAQARASTWGASV